MIKVLASLTKKERIKKLVSEIKRHKKLYYNEQPEISDREFDDLEDKLRKLDPNNTILTKVGTAAKGRKIQLPYYMPSLDKRKNASSIEAFLDNYEGPYLVSDKLDGVSLLGTYNSRGKFTLYTRGDGVNGQDITNFGQHLNLPTVKQDIAIRAEIIVPKSKFKALVKKSETPDSFNLRNLVSGLVNRTKGDSPELKNANIVAYEVIKPSLKPSQQFAKLKALGFKVAYSKVYNELTVDLLNEILAQRKEKSPYDIDGIVVTQDKVHTRTKSGNPDYSFAFKNNALSKQYDVVVKEVEWNLSKHGYLKPRILIEPLKHHTGVTIKHFTGFNAKFIFDNKIGPGAIMRVVRSGDVIPHIQEIVKKAKRPSMPKEDWIWNETGVDAILKGEDSSNTVVMRQLSFFFATIGVDGLRSGILSRLIDIGLDTPEKILKATTRKIMQAEGIQKTSAEKIRSNIDLALQTVTMPQLMAGSGLLGRGIGVDRMEALLDELPNVLKLTPAKAQGLIAEVPGFSTKLATQIAAGIPKFNKFYAKLGITAKKPVKIKTISSKLKNQAICFTGFRSNSLKDYVEKNGGKVVNSVNSKTTLLLIKSLGSGSSKESTAHKLGIKIQSLADFMRNNPQATL